MVCVRTAWLDLNGATVLLEDPAAGYFCSQLDLGYPTPRDVVNNRPDRNGADDRTQYFGIRTVTIQLEVLQGAGARVDEIAGLFGPYLDPAQRPVLHYILDRDTNPERTLTLRAAAFTAPVSGPYQRSIQLQFVAADPLARDPLTKTATTPLGGMVTIATPGDVPIWPRFRITGPVTAAPMLQFVPTAGYIWWFGFISSFAIAAGHFVDIDTDARTVYRDGDPGSPALGSVDWTISSWQPLPPAPSTTDMTLAGTGPSSATHVTAYWQDGYLT